MTWAVDVVSFEGRSVAEQYDVIRRASLLVTVSGTGSHWAMFLGEGTGSIVIKSNGYDVNEHICTILSSVFCLSVNSTAVNTTQSLQRADIYVEDVDMKRALQTAGQRLQHSQCR